MDPMKRYLIEETIEDYAQGRITRRQALRSLTALAGAVVGAQLLAACGSKESKDSKESKPAADAAAKAAADAAPPSGKPLVAPDDPEIVAGKAELPGEGATLTGYLARPSKDGSYPIVLVCHENRGLTAHIEDVTRRVAKAGYLGMAVDLLSREGGTAAHAYDDVPGVLGNAPPERHVGDFLAGLAHAKQQASARADRVGMTGFCFGGGMTWRVAAALPELRAGVPFYGMPIEVDQVPKIQAAILGIYAEKDDRINQAVPAVEEAMKKHGKTFEKKVYPGTQHAFHNDTRDRYVETAAKDAWKETLAWFAKYLAVATLVLAVGACKKDARKDETQAKGTTATQKTDRTPPPAPAPDAAAPAADPIAAAVAAPDRSETDRALDAGRHPAEVLAFFRVAPGQTIGEIFSGGGYTNELLARVVGEGGKVYAHNTTEILDRFARQPWTERAAKPVMKNVIAVEQPLDAPFPPEAKDLDAVITILNYHDAIWMKADRAKMNKAVFDALRPGGVYGVVDHSAAEGSGVRDAETLHRIDEAVVKEEVLAAGFQLDGESDVLRNPDDKRDWNSSPNAAAERRGTSDRFVLRFVKP